MAKKKQQGGLLKGKSHKQGGMPAVIAGKEPVELEGGEYIIKKSTVDKLGVDTLDAINKGKMQVGGQVPPMKRFPKEVRMREYGGHTTVHSPKKMGAGGPIAVHSHSEYKAGQ